MLNPNLSYPAFNIERMFDTLDNLLSQLQNFVERTDPESVSRERSVELYEKCCLGERLFAAAKALASRQVADSNAWYDFPHRSPAHLLAALSRSSVGHAAVVLNSAALMKELPSVEAAFREGALTEGQAVEVVSAACLAPSTRVICSARQGKAACSLRSWPPE